MVIISTPIIDHELGLVFVDINKKRYLLKLEEWEILEREILKGEEDEDAL